MKGEEIKNFVKEKHGDFIDKNFFDKYENVYDNVVVKFFQQIMNENGIDPSKSFSDLKKLKNVEGEFEEKGGEIDDIYEEAQRLAEEEDEEEQKSEWEDEWYEEHDEDEEPDESEFEYEPDYKMQAYWFEQHFIDLAEQHSEDMKEYAKQVIRYARMRNAFGLDFINVVFGQWDQLGSSYYEIIENRIKVEKEWLKTLRSNKRNLIKAPFEDVNLEEAWVEE